MHVIALSDTTASCLLIFICLFSSFSFLSITFSHVSVPSKDNELVWSSNNCLLYLIRKRSNYETVNGVLSSKTSSFPQVLQNISPTVTSNCPRQPPSMLFVAFQRISFFNSLLGLKVSPVCPEIGHVTQNTN